MAIEHDLIVIADEIHSDLVYDGRKHIPFATLGAEIAARTVTITSATKSFNIPGLRCGVMHFGTPELRRRFARAIPSRLVGGCSGLGIDATVAAWTLSDDWLDAVVAHLTAARDRVIEVLRAELPQVRCHAPEGTYLAWLDFRELHLKMPAFQFFHDHARVALSAGENFDPDCAQFARLNFATSMPILDRILERLVTAARMRPLCSDPNGSPVANARPCHLPADAPQTAREINSATASGHLRWFVITSPRRGLTWNAARRASRIGATRIRGAYWQLVTFRY